MLKPKLKQVTIKMRSKKKSYKLKHIKNSWADDVPVGGESRRKTRRRLSKERRGVKEERWVETTKRKEEARLSNKQLVGGRLIVELWISVFDEQ